MHISGCKAYFLIVLQLLNFYPVNALSLNSLISKISASFQINFRFALRKNVSSFVLNSDSYFQLHEIYPITISFDEWDGDQEIVGKEAYYSAPAKRYSLQKIKLFITFTFTVRELCYVITKSGHIIGVNHNVLFYNISPLKHTASGETVNQITKLGITCPLTFITVTSHSIDSKW